MTKLYKNVLCIILAGLFCTCLSVPAKADVFINGKYRLMQPETEINAAADEEDIFDNNVYTDADTVHYVQIALNVLRYNCGSPDGSKGPRTTARIMEYQYDNGLDVNGIIDDILLLSLGLEEQD